MCPTPPCSAAAAAPEARRTAGHGTPHTPAWMSDAPATTRASCSSAAFRSSPPASAADPAVVAARQRRTRMCVSPGPARLTARTLMTAQHLRSAPAAMSLNPIGLSVLIATCCGGGGASRAGQRDMDDGGTCTLRTSSVLRSTASYTLRGGTVTSMVRHEGPHRRGWVPRRTHTPAAPDPR